MRVLTEIGLVIVVFFALNSAMKQHDLRPLDSNTGIHCVVCGKPATMTNLSPFAQKILLSSFLQKTRLYPYAWCDAHKAQAQKTARLIRIFFAIILAFGIASFLTRLILGTPRWQQG